MRLFNKIVAVAFSLAVWGHRDALAEPPPPDAPTNPQPAAPTTPTTPTDASTIGTTPADSPQAANPPPVETPLPEKPPESPPEPAITAPPEKGLPRLHIEANRFPVRLLRIERVMSDDAGEGILAKTICTAPCDQVIDGRRRQTFFFGAEGMVPSRGFRMASLRGNIVARVDGGSIVARQTGFLLGGFGGAAMLGGATMLGVGYGLGGTHLSAEGKIVEGPNPNLTTGGFITLGVGAALVTTAVILVLTAKTKITLLQADDSTARVSLEMGRLRF